jgi:hypothetical protein
MSDSLSHQGGLIRVSSGFTLAALEVRREDLVTAVSTRMQLCRNAGIDERKFGVACRQLFTIELIAGD